MAVVAEVEELLARRLVLLSGQVGQLVVAVEMHFEGAPAVVASPVSSRSLTPVSPAAASRVGNQSSAVTISFETAPGLDAARPAHEAGTRKAPSQLVFFSLRNGVMAASGHEFMCGPLSVV